PRDAPTPARRTRPPRARLMARPLDAEARRGEILDRAFALFADQGYHALSMRDLARELGATTGALYHWFDGKPALFAAMLERQVRRQVDDALAAVGTAPTHARLDALGAHIVREADDLQRTLVVALDFHREHPGGGTPLAGALAAYQEGMVAGLGLAPDAARLVLSVVVGELLQRILDPARDLSTLARLLPDLARTTAA
ncbi:MAG: TetR/AcrR family transcriptional regulator, partial [Myxococcota bacterium]